MQRVGQRWWRRGGLIVTITNHFSGVPLAPIVPATVYQGCGISSVITGPGAPGTCTPANTAPNIVAATVGQCDGSANGDTDPGRDGDTAAGCRAAVGAAAPGNGQYRTLIGPEQFGHG